MISTPSIEDEGWDLRPDRRTSMLWFSCVAMARVLERCAAFGFQATLHHRGTLITWILVSGITVFLRTLSVNGSNDQNTTGSEYPVELLTI